MPRHADEDDSNSHGPDQVIAQRDRHRLAMVRTALQRGRTALALQPVVYAEDPGKVAFEEGLIRLLDDTGREVPARAFIDVAEPTEAGRMIDCAALELGFEALRADPGLRLALNMSARSIGHSRWSEILAEGLSCDVTAGERLILEITEGSAMQAPERIAPFILGLQRQGVSFALDDFGAGHTAFRYLRDFCFDIVKIDRQFIAGVHRDPDCQVLVRALSMIARQFDMMTVAEGVEQAEDADWLRDHGVDSLQGYLYGRPRILPNHTEEAALRRA